MKKNPLQRLGYGDDGALVVKRHSFFRKVIWKNVLERSVIPPYIPPLMGPQDTSHFSEEFTKMPLDSPPLESQLTHLNQDEFIGFSFTAESLDLLHG